MSGISPNRCKKNGKKSIVQNGTEEVHVKSVKLNTTRATRPSADERKRTMKDRLSHEKGDVTELGTCIVKHIKNLSLGNDNGENCIPSTSLLNTKDSVEDLLKEQRLSSLKDRAEALSDDVSFYGNESIDPSEVREKFTYSYQYYPKNTKSIKFTNQVTVLYFNGDDVLCESMEPLKKELDQQLRNKEMRRAHLMKGHDNVYLF